jgi:hypothetical protein
MQFFGIELVDSAGKPGGVRYINLASITRADYLKPKQHRGNAEMMIHFSDGLNLKVEGSLAEQLMQNLEKLQVPPI